MTALKYVIIALQIVFSLILIAVVLFQSGSQRGLSGSIAGGAETFFGKNKGKTIDAKLKKYTSVVAILFLLSSIGLNLVFQAEDKKAQEELAQKIAAEAEAQAEADEIVVDDSAVEGEAESGETAE